MSSCELCGAPEAQMTAKVEGVDFKVCRNCVKHGSARPAPSNYSHNNSRSYSPSPRREGPEQHLLPNVSELLRQAREKKGMTLEEFAKFLQEKESVVAKWESGSIKPPIPAAIRVGKLLSVYLIERENKNNGHDKDSSERTSSSDHSTHQHTNNNNQHSTNNNHSNSPKVSDELTLGDFIKVKKR